MYICPNQVISPSPPPHHVHMVRSLYLLLYSCPTNRFICMYHFSRFHVYAWRRQWHPAPVLLPGKSHGWRSLVGCSPWGPRKQLHFHLSLSCIGEGNGNPLQCSCLENPRDGGAWWAAVYGFAQSRTRLKRLSSSSSSSNKVWVDREFCQSTPGIVLVAISGRRSH